MNPSIHLDKFLREHDEFIEKLSHEMNQPGDKKKVIHVLRAVLHTLRDRLTIQQSFHVLAQLPVFLKLYYIEGWKYREKPLKFNSLDQFSRAVKKEQFHLGEREFNWEKSTNEIVNIILSSLRKYLDDGIIRNIFAEIPGSLHSMFA